MVTIEDLLEEIVGEIRDEYDDESEPIVDEGNGTFVFLATVSVGDMVEQLGVAVEREGFETVGGYLLSRLGRVPTVGETVEVEVHENRRCIKTGVVTRVIHPSPHRVEPPCPYFGECGGCQWQHVAYSHQLEMKRDVLKRHLEEVAGLKSPNVSPTIASPSQSGYRNHARFSVDRKGSLGFTRTGTHRPLEIDRCLLMHEDINAVLSELQGKGKGLRQVAVRCGVNTGSLLI